ncbi:MAG: hypothetical protein ACHQYQ_10995 [Bacteriovoracales bacterium]
MKTKIIGISFGVGLIVAIIFIVKNQEFVESPQTKDGKKLAKPAPKEEEKTISPSIKSKGLVVTEKSSPLVKMPDPEQKEEMEAFFNKAFIAWNDKVASLIVNELKLGQDAIDKYQKIRNDYYESQFSLFQVHTANETKGSENKDEQRRLASTISNVKAQLEADYGIDLDKDELNSKEDISKVQNAIQNALGQDNKKFLGNHLNKVKDVLGDEGFKKYQKLKDDFNNEISEGGSEPLFKI